MASLIKNHILKYLSKFTKGLSTDKINLSTFKGEGELTNLELDENILTDLLELPSWLRLTHAFCNRVSFRVHWTKLKSVPIVLSLDEVTIAVETCEELRSTNCQEGRSSYTEAGKYSFSHKVIDGVTVTVKTVNITFKSPAFVSKIELSRIIVQSKSPYWEDHELKYTRLRDNTRQQILLFKELEWQNARIETKSTVDNSLAPIRLLTDKAICRITLKKHLSDSSVLGSRLAILLEDVLWVLTDSQLKAALHFLDSLAGLIQKATEETRKKKAARKLETLPEYQAQQYQRERTGNEILSSSKLFSQFDVVETSYHFQARTIDLHFSDDPSARRSCHPELSKGGALQVTLKLFKIDYYPYHLAIADRNHWVKYRSGVSNVMEWLKEAQVSFTSSLLDIFSDNSTHTVKNNMNRSKVDSSPSPCQITHQPDNLQANILGRVNKLMTSCTILRIADFNLYQVSVPSTKKHVLKDFVSALRKSRRSSHGQGDKERCTENDPVIHAEFTYSYFPGDDPFPLPPPKFYVHLNPIQIHFDVLSILWLRAFALNLHESLLQTSAAQDASNSSLLYFDIKLEAKQPRVVFESAIDHPGQKDRPKSLHMQASRVKITNVRNSDSSRAELGKCLDSFKMCSLFFNSDFPSVQNDLSVLNKKFLDHVNGTDNVRPCPSRVQGNSMKDLTAQFRSDLLWTESRDVWSVHLEPVFGDFYGTRAIGKEYPIPFLDAFPLTLWVYFKIPSDMAADVARDDDNGPDIPILAHITTLVSLQLNHYQYLFLLRLLEDVKELATYLEIDSNRSSTAILRSTLVVGAVIPQVEVTFVMPSQSPGKESSGGDVESVYPDSSSLQDDTAALGGCHSSTSFLNQLPGNIHSEKKNPVVETPTEIHHNSAVGHITRTTSTNKTLNGCPKIPSLSSKALSTDTISYSQQSAPFSLISSSIKKKFDKVMTSLDLSSKYSPDDVENASIRSDNSSGSENMTNMCVDHFGNMFDVTFADGVESLFQTGFTCPEQGEVVSVAYEANEDTLTSPTSERDSFTSFCRRRDLVSLSTFKFGKIELVAQTDSTCSTNKLQISSLLLEECPSIAWDEFQNKFSSRTRDWVELPLDAGVRPKVRLRMTHVLKPEYKCICGIQTSDSKAIFKWFEDVIEVRLQSVYLKVNASTLTGLSDLIEDEVIRAPFPVTVHLEDIKLHITEDRPPNNITSPGAVPANIAITQMTVHRNEAGVIEIRPPINTETVNRSQNELDNPMSTKMQRLLSENEELRRRLGTLENLSEENYRLKKEKHDSESSLRSKLEQAQNTISSLLDNKEELLDEIHILNSKLHPENNSKR